MGLFKEIYCAECSKKTNILTRTKLCDGNYLCSDCTLIIPSYMKKSAYKKYALDDYRNFKEYITYSNKHLRPVFHETHSFYKLHIDTENLIFYIGYGIDEETIFFDFEDVTRFDMVFCAEDYKDGLLGSRVRGKIMVELGVSFPYFYYDDILVNNAKAKARKTFMGSKIEYGNPDGMDDFMFYFERAWREALEQAEEDDDDSSNYESSSISELQQAMSLFMIDNLDEITPEKLKALRNKLIKTFHPDIGTDEDNKHAQKINAAYEIIKDAINKE